MSASCRSCHAPVVWAVTERGKRMPVDANPTPDGNIRLSHRQVDEPPVAVYVGEAERETLTAQAAARGETLRLFVSHFATCVDAAKHRKRP